MTSTLTTAEKFKLDFLFKKTLGAPAALGTTFTAPAEAGGSSKPKIIKNLVINQEIPTTAPSTDLSMVDISSVYIPTGSNNTADTKYISTTYPYIAKYTLRLKSSTAGFSYYYNDPASGLNLLESAIPFNYDPFSSYAYEVKLDDVVVPGSGIDTAGTKSWILDTDAGYLYFPNKDAGTPVITITFWRYEGTYGVGSGSGISNFGNLTVSHLSPFDYTIDSNLFILETAVASGENGNLNSTQVVYSTVDCSFSGNLTVGGTITVGNYAANSIPSSAIIGGVGGGGISNFGNLTVSHLSPFDYTIDSNLFILETAVASGENGNLNGTQVVYSTVDCSFSGNLYVGGTITAGTTYYTTSDYRIKANIISLSDTSFSVDLLRPVTYMNTSLGKSDIGFIAHEVQEQFPFLVTGEKDETNYQTLNYTGLIGLLTNEIQDLKKEFKEIRREFASYTQ